MIDIILKALTFLLIIILGYIFKQTKLLKKKDADTLATIVMNITLPCALLSNAVSFTIDISLIITLCIGIGANILMIFLGYLFAIKRGPEEKAAYMINCSGYNIGNFTIPFVQTFFSSLGMIYICLFDIGNALMGLGGTFSIASRVSSKEKNFNFKNILLKLFSSVPFDVYIIILILALLKIEVPAQIVEMTSIIGNANTFLAMFMIGLYLNININLAEIKSVIEIIIIRFLGTTVLALIIYFVFPLPLVAKQIIIMCIYSPITSVAPVFSYKCGYKGDVPALVNSISIIFSIVYLTILLMIFRI